MRFSFLQLLTDMSKLAAFNAANCLFLFHAAQFAFGNEPAFTADSTEYTAFNDLFTEPLEELVLRFVLS